MDKIDEVFKQIDRVDFLPEEVREYAEADRALPIGFDQTNSQPYTVKQMLAWLDVRTGQKILDVGSGSGWTTALLSKLVESKGKVFAVEIIPELVEFGRKNCQNIGLKNVEFFQAGNELGLPELAPFDRILVSAGAEELPVELIKQLKPEGKIVIPVKSDILEIKKLVSGLLESTIHPGFIFVPLRQSK